LPTNPAHYLQVFAAQTPLYKAAFASANKIAWMVHGSIQYTGNAHQNHTEHQTADFTYSDQTS
jgi:hypothetical protein